MAIRQLTDQFLKDLEKAILDKTGVDCKMIKLATIAKHLSVPLSRLKEFEVIDTVKFAKIRSTDAGYENVTGVMVTMRGFLYDSNFIIEADYVSKNTSSVNKGWCWDINEEVIFDADLVNPYEDFEGCIDMKEWVQLDP